MHEIVWQDRLCKLENGTFMLSATGRHDDFDFGEARAPSGAFAGRIGQMIRYLPDGKLAPDGPLTDCIGLELMENGWLKLLGSDGSQWAITDNPWTNGRIIMLLWPEESP